MILQNDRPRYDFEHELFLSHFCDDPLSMMKNLELGGSDYIAFLWKRFLEAQDTSDGLQTPPIVYTKEDFAVRTGKKDDLRYGIIRMPKATAIFQCSRIGIVVSQDGGYSNCYTVERMEEHDYALFSWHVQDDSFLSRFSGFSEEEGEMANQMVLEMLSPNKGRG